MVTPTAHEDLVVCDARTMADCKGIHRILSEARSILVSGRGGTGIDAWRRGDTTVSIEGHRILSMTTSTRDLDRTTILTLDETDREEDRSQWESARRIVDLFASTVLSMARNGADDGSDDGLAHLVGIMSAACRLADREDRLIRIVRPSAFGRGTIQALHPEGLEETLVLSESTNVRLFDGMKPMRRLRIRMEAKNERPDRWRGGRSKQREETWEASLHPIVMESEIDDVLGSARVIMESGLGTDELRLVPCDR